MFISLKKMYFSRFVKDPSFSVSCSFSMLESWTSFVYLFNMGDIGAINLANNKIFLLKKFKIIVEDLINI